MKIVVKFTLHPPGPTGTGIMKRNRGIFDTVLSVRTLPLVFLYVPDHSPIRGNWADTGAQPAVRSLCKFIRLRISPVVML